MAYKQLKRGDYERIVTERLAFGAPVEEVAAMVGCGQTSVVMITAGFKAVQEKDWNKAIDLVVDKGTPLDAIKWAAEKCNIELPQNFLKEVELCRISKNSRTKEPRSVPEPDPVPLTDHWEEEKRFFQAMIAEQQKTNELLEQLFDAVIPKWTGDMKDNLNVNCDLINQTLKRIEDKTEAIKINVRRKGM